MTELVRRFKGDELFRNILPFVRELALGRERGAHRPGKADKEFEKQASDLILRVILNRPGELPVLFHPENVDSTDKECFIKKIVGLHPAGKEAFLALPAQVRMIVNERAEDGIVPGPAVVHADAFQRCDNLLEVWGVVQEIPVRGHPRIRIRPGQKNIVEKTGIEQLHYFSYFRIQTRARFEVLHSCTIWHNRVTSDMR